MEMLFSLLPVLFVLHEKKLAAACLLILLHSLTGFFSSFLLLLCDGRNKRQERQDRKSVTI